MLSFIGKVKSSAVYLKYCINCFCCWLTFIGGLPSELAATSGVLDISDIRQSFNHDESSSISLLIKGKLRDLQNY